MRPPDTRWIVRPLVIVLGLGLAVVALEAGLRIFRAHSPRLNALLYSPAVRTHFDDFDTTPELLATSTFGYHPLGHTPGFVLNSRGFRTDEYTEKKPAGVYRVIALGDSFTFDSYGVPIEQMWHQVLERELAARTGRRVEVLSLSAHGVGPRFLLRLWELEGRRLDPDLVILAFFVGNDFTDEAGTRLDPTLDAGLSRWSLSYRLVRNLIRLRRWEDSSSSDVVAAPTGPESRGGFEHPGYASTYDPEIPAFDQDTFERIERDCLLAFAGPDRERFDRLFTDTAAVLERLARDVERTGASFATMIIPDQVQIDAALRERLESGLSNAALEIDRPQERLRAYLTARRITYLDLLELFRDSVGERRLYKFRDTHWSAEGNRLAGTALAEFLVGRALVPEALPTPRPRDPGRRPGEGGAGSRS